MEERSIAAEHRDRVAAYAKVDPLALRRVARFREPYGVFELTDGRASLTAKGRLLRSDSPVWAHPALQSGPLAARCELRPGDLFGDVPAADAYVLAQVLHDWDDDHASRILWGLGRAAPPGARAFVLTLVIPEGGGAHPAKLADIGMMALFGSGRERTEAELRDLLANAGWRVAAVMPNRVATVIAATVAEPSKGSQS